MRDEGTIFGSPLLNGHGCLGTPEQQGAEHADHNVVARIEQFLQASEAADTCSGGFAIRGANGGLHGGEVGRGERNGFEFGEDAGEQIEVMGGLVEAVDDRQHPVADGAAEKAFHDRNGDEREAGLESHKRGGEPPEQHGAGDQGEEQGGEALPFRERSGWRGGPLNQVFGVDAGTEVLAKDCQLFAQVEQGPEFRDRLVAGL